MKNQNHKTELQDKSHIQFIERSLWDSYYKKTASGRQTQSEKIIYKICEYDEGRKFREQLENH